MDDETAVYIPASGLTRSDFAKVMLLVGIVLGMRVWQLTHTAVTARDSIGYIRIAWRLEHGDWLKVLPRAPQHPLYPMAILAMSLPVRHFLPNDLPQAMQLSAQLTSALASLLLILPMYLLGRELFTRHIAFWGCLLFQCLPSAGRVMGDGLSEPLFLLCTVSSLYLAVRALRDQSKTAF
ncbi:MAG: glycosyltransferase family 39 protein, partial [Candidatus Acidiferrum sp.]